MSRRQGYEYFTRGPSRDQRVRNVFVACCSLVMRACWCEIDREQSTPASCRVRPASRVDQRATGSNQHLLSAGSAPPAEWTSVQQGAINTCFLLGPPRQPSGLACNREQSTPASCRVRPASRVDQRATGSNQHLLPAGFAPPAEWTSVQQGAINTCFLQGPPHQPSVLVCNREQSTPASCRVRPTSRVD